MRCLLLAAVLLIVACSAAPTSATGPVAREAVKHRATIRREANHVWGVRSRADVFAGQVHQESGFNPDARSSVGAGGMAQFMPGTAVWIGNLYPADLRPVNVYDPRWAIRALVRYDRWLWEKFPRAAGEADRWGFALASYNAGLGWVQKEARLAPDSTRWYESAEDVCLRRASACRESRGYARNIWFRWRPLYAGW